MDIKINPFEDQRGIHPLEQEIFGLTLIQLTSMIYVENITDPKDLAYEVAQVIFKHLEEHVIRAADLLNYHG